MSNTEKKIVIFLVVAFIVGNVVLFIKRERLKRDLNHFQVETVVQKKNINMATQAELEMLPGIGQVIAQRIIAYRKDNGPFRTPKDLLGVQGISEKKLEQIKDLITLQ